MVKQNIEIPRPVEISDEGLMTAPLSALVEDPDNPREPRDFEYDRNPTFRALVDSVAANGVLEPVRVFSTNRFGGPSQLHMLTGHRRKAAAEKANELKVEAWEALKARGEDDSAEPILIERVPVTVLPEPETDFDRRSSMWTAELLHENWPTRRLIGFFATTYDLAPPSVQQNPRELALQLGLPLARTKLFVSIVTSDVLRKAATNFEEQPLPSQGREKTMRSIIRCANVLMNERSTVARKVTGLAGSGERVWDRLHETLIAKAGEYADRDDLGSGPGVLLERTAPLLRDHEEYPDEVLIDWLTKPGVLARDVVTRRKARKTFVDAHGGTSPLMVEVRSHVRPRPGRMDEADLQAYVDDLQATIGLLSEAARKGRDALHRKASDGG